MNNWRKVPLFTLASLLGLILLSSAGAEVSQEGLKSNPNPMVIQSESMEVNDDQRIVTFTGDVNAKRDDFTIDCEKMVVYYTKASSQEKKGEYNNKVERIVATEKVKIIRADGGVATAERGEYFEEEDKLVLTGKPVVKQGNNFVEGDRITLFLNENRSVVESSDSKKVKAVIFPKDKER